MISTYLYDLLLASVISYYLHPSIIVVIIFIVHLRIILILWVHAVAFLADFLEMSVVIQVLQIEHVDTKVVQT